MSPDKLDTIQYHANVIRGWAEDEAKGTYKEGLLNGMCAVASAELWRKLAGGGISSEIHVWLEENSPSAHVFLVIDDHVIDVTATQFKPFRNKKIYIEHKRIAEAWPWYSTTKMFESPDRLIKWQKKSKWPEDQIAWTPWKK